jgi:Fur family peroxide stress response transcriptional regulator
MIETLRARGLRITAQRIALVEAFAGDASHPTAQALFERLRSAFPSMSFATVYNTLDALAEAGLSSTLTHVRGLGSAARFDPNTNAHHHAVCDVCGAISDIPARTLAPEASAEARIADAAPGFVVTHVERTYRGTCAACSKKRKKEN